MRKIFMDKSIQWDRLEHGIMVDKSKTVVGVVGIGNGAGATFTAMNLAFCMAEMSEGITFAEGHNHKSGEVRAFEMLSVDHRFRKKNGHMTNLYKKVNWVTEVKNPAEIPGRTIIIDNPEKYDGIDIVAGIVDSLPSRIEAGLEVFKELRELQIPVIWVFNKDSRQADIKRTEQYLKIKFDCRQEMLSQEVFYKAELGCTQQFFLQRPQGIERLACMILEYNK